MTNNDGIYCLESKPNGHLFFTYWFVEAWRKFGGKVKVRIPIPHIIRVVFGRYLSFNISRSMGRLVVCGCHRIESVSWPYNYLYEIVPMMWDLWPGNYRWFKRFLRLNRVRLVFCSSRINVEKLRRDFPKMRVCWIPEAVDVSQYPEGPKLSDRKVDVLSYGRQMKEVDEKCRDMAAAGKILYQRGLGSDFGSLIPALHSAKIAICYPKSDTNPELAGDVETLTIRYWEAMLTGTLMVGRAPKELIDVCGYNPVIDMMPVDAEKVLSTVLNNLAEYQDLANRNRAIAAEKADWNDRLKIMNDNMKGIFNDVRCQVQSRENS